MNSKIPYFNLKKQIESLKEEIFEAFNGVIVNGEFSSGKYIENFESLFSSYCKIDYCIGVSSGTSALQLALLASGIKPGDEVIVPGNTFFATPAAVSHCGGIPVFADCDKFTWNIDSEKAIQCITPKTKAIIGVHLYGETYDYQQLKKIANDNNLVLIEDASQAHGAKFKGIFSGNLSDIGCFSFFPSKNMGAFGEAGAVVTNNADWYEKVKMLRNYGMKEKFNHEEIGFNMKMDSLQAAVLSIKLKHLNDFNVKRKQIASKYLNNVKNPLIVFQHKPDWADHVYHLLVITTTDKKRLVNYLNNNNIFPAEHYPIPCHLQKAYSFLKYKKGDLPNSEYLASNCLSLPLYPEMEDETTDYIIEILNKYD